MSKSQKGQGLVMLVIIIAIVVVVILVLDPHLLGASSGTLAMLWGKVVAGFHWLVAGVQHGNLTAIVIAALVVLGIIWLLFGRR